MNTPSKWSDRTRIYPVAMVNLVILVTRVYLPIPLRFGWVSIQITPLELVLLESCLLRVSYEIPRRNGRIKQGITPFQW